jgi:hypothetical protein
LLSLIKKHSLFLNINLVLLLRESLVVFYAEYCCVGYVAIFRYRPLLDADAKSNANILCIAIALPPKTTSFY